MVNDTLDAETYDIVVLPAPANDLTMDAIKKLQGLPAKWRQSGKQLIYVADYTQSVTPNLDAFLKDWNLQVDSSYVREDDNNRNQTVQIVASAGKGLIAPSYRWVIRRTTAAISPTAVCPSWHRWHVPFRSCPPITAVWYTACCKFRHFLCIPADPAGFLRRGHHGGSFRGESGGNRGNDYRGRCHHKL